MRNQNPLIQKCKTTGHDTNMNGARRNKYQVALRSVKSLEIILKEISLCLSEKPSSDYLNTQINTLVETANNGLL